MNISVNTTETTRLADAADLIAPLEIPAHHAVSPPIFQTSSFLFDSYANLADVFAGRSDRYIYSRGDNPTVRELERLIARLERTEAARGFASGMAAISASVMPFVKTGDRIVAVKNLYSDAYRLFEVVLGKLGVSTDYVDGSDTEAVIAALPGAKLVYLESPTSMTFTLQDVAAIARAARAADAISIIDNSWATPLYQKPATLGIDLVVHAASKYLGGHSDTVAGLVAGSKALIGRINHESFHYLGGKMSPFDAWLVLRGMRTLPLRMRQHMQGGLAVGEALQAHPMVTALRHPAFVPHPGSAHLTGYGGVFAFDLAEAVEIPRFVDALRVVRIGVSWGGPESLVVPAMAALDLAGPVNSFRRFGVSPRTVRFATGLEDPALLIDDIVQAIEKARR
jgi:cystathionine beta-lyase/cystathionine gamma-synthase